MGSESDNILTVEQINKAIMIANSFREALGNKDLLEDLPPGEPGRSDTCILAQAFSSGFRVLPEGNQSFTKSTFSQSQLHDKIDADWWHLTGDLMDFEYESLKKWADQWELPIRKEMESTFVVILLPPDIGVIAEEFDYFCMPKKYYTNQKQFMRANMFVKARARVEAQEKKRLLHS